MKLSLTQLRLTGLLIMLVIIVCDQWSKAWVLSAVERMEFPMAVTPYFNLVLVFNKGVSFGMLAGATTWMPLALTIFLSLIVLALIVWLFKATESSVVISLGTIIGGAIGNLIDRARLGAVTDFLDFHVGNYHWPAFNVADSAIFIGVVIFIFTNIIPAKPIKKEDA